MSKLRVFLLLIIVVLSSSSLAYGGISLPWSTTYNCSDWLQYSDSLNCDGLSRAGGWTTASGDYEQITVAANNPNGDGGKGQRHWIGPGTNNNSGGTRVSFNTPQTNIWIRWYMRWQSGFGDFSTFKVLYLYPSSGTGAVFHVGTPGIGGINLYSTRDHYNCSSCGWGSGFYPSGISDGTWQLFEIHINTTTGVFQAWLNEQLVVDRNDVDFGGVNSISQFTIGSNAKYVSNSGTMYVDYDDMAISNTGYIGPLAGTSGGGGGNVDQNPPTASITSPSSGQTVSGNVVLAASASDDVGVSGVQFQIDGSDYGSLDTTAPYSVNVDTASFPDGVCNVTALAVDAAGNQGASPSINLTISNGSSNGGTSPSPSEGSILFSEGFEDANLASRGWYDNTNLQVTSAEHIPGSTRALEFNFNQGDTSPTTGGAIRKKFTGTEQVYVSYYVKYSSNWQGSNQSYHPHEFYLLTNKSDDWSNLANTHLTAYIEQNEGEPLIAIQDGQNVDTSNINVDLTSVTENRAVAGCNGDSDGYGPGTCYASGGKYYNGKQWRAGANYFQDNSGPYYKNDWHLVEVLFKLNSITNGQANNDGVIKYLYDGVPIIDVADVVFRTGQHADMKFNQFVIGPYIGSGSPVDQSFWIDNLTISTGVTTTDNEIATPQGFNLVQN